MKYYIFIFTVFLSCQPNNNNSKERKYPYSEDFKTYFQSVFKQSIKNNNSYFVIPLNSCLECVDSALYNLRYRNFNYNVLFIGTTEDSIRLRDIDLIRQKYNCFFDPNNELIDYSTGIGIPSLLKSDNNGAINYIKEFHFGSWILESEK